MPVMVLLRTKIWALFVFWRHLPLAFFFPPIRICCRFVQINVKIEEIKELRSAHRAKLDQW